MITVKDKNKDRVVRHKRVRNTVVGTTERPRLSVYRSLSNIYAQIIDVFDRGGYLYTGRVQAVADGARASGLKF